MNKLQKAEHNGKMVALALEASHRLQGTCDSLASLGEEHEAAEMDDAFCAQLDSEVFCCEQCGWWFEQSQMAMRKDEAWICEDCTDDDDLIEE